MRGICQSIWVKWHRKMNKWTVFWLSSISIELYFEGIWCREGNNSKKNHIGSHKKSQNFSLSKWLIISYWRYSLTFFSLFLHFLLWLLFCDCVIGVNVIARASKEAHKKQKILSTGSIKCRLFSFGFLGLYRVLAQVGALFLLRLNSFPLPLLWAIDIRHRRIWISVK